MLKIGEFSGITGISVSMLRNYDRLGILKPELTDEKTGYRYYSQDQIPLAHRIQIFKELGFSLKEIPALNAFSPMEVRFMMSRKIVEKQAELSVLQEQIQKMKQAQEDYNLYIEHAFSISREWMPARTVVALTANLRHEGSEEAIYMSMMEVCESCKLRPLYGHPVYAITHSADYVYSVFNTEIQIPVGEITGDTGVLELKRIPETEVVQVNFKGADDEIAQMSKFVRRYTDNIGYQIDGAPLRQIGTIESEGLKLVPKAEIQTFYYPVTAMYDE